MSGGRRYWGILGLSAGCFASLCLAGRSQASARPWIQAPRLPAALCAPILAAVAAGELHQLVRECVDPTLRLLADTMRSHGIYLEALKSLAVSTPHAAALACGLAA